MIFPGIFRKKKDEVHYIGGAEVLPPPLAGEDEAVCIEMLTSDESGQLARKQLIEHNLRLVVYIAKKFETAEALRKDDNYIHSALYYMDEQLYAANSEVNNILKIYFPEQFGERAFLDYPIGHFFLSITNMWDPNSQSLCIKDINDLYACGKL